MATFFPQPGPNRREFLQTAGGAIAGASLVSPWPAVPAGAKRRYAIVGSGHRGSGMWGTELLAQHREAIDMVGLFDINPLRAEAARGLLQTTAPTFTDFDRLCDAVKPELVAVTTVDATHSHYIARALDRGIDVITEKPMFTELAQCREVLEAERRNKRQVAMAFNYRYAPKHEQTYRLLRDAGLGTVTSVDFHWFLDVIHGADYFRRWHRLKNRSGSLWVHKASHHFDLVNWWLGADPVEVSAFGSLRRYGRNGRVRHTHCRPCPHKAACEFAFDMTTDKRLMALYASAESFDGYHRDGCVFREDCDIYDTMSAIVRYSNGTSMSYSVNAFMPIEGFQVAFNCEFGRLEVRNYERQGWTMPCETEYWVTKNFAREQQHLTMDLKPGGHSGGDPRLRSAIFSGAPLADYYAVPTSRAGAMACLTGVAARMSIEQRRTIRIADLLPEAGLAAATR